MVDCGSLRFIAVRSPNEQVKRPEQAARTTTDIHFGTGIAGRKPAACSGPLEPLVMRLCFSFCTMIMAVADVAAKLGDDLKLCAHRRHTNQFVFAVETGRAERAVSCFCVVQVTVED